MRCVFCGLESGEPRSHNQANTCINRLREALDAANATIAERDARIAELEKTAQAPKPVRVAKRAREV